LSISAEKSAGQGSCAAELVSLEFSPTSMAELTWWFNSIWHIPIAGLLQKFAKGWEISLAHMVESETS
jgi:hypothetical protein